MKIKVCYIMPVLITLLTMSLAAQTSGGGADLLFEQGKYQEAIDICLRELEESPKKIDAYCYLVWSYERLNRWNDVLTYAKKGMEVSRSDRRMIMAAGKALYYLGQNRESLKYFEEYAVYVNVAYGKDEIYYFMGEVYVRLGEFNNADTAFSTAVYYNSKNAYWLARLGYAREMAKDYEWSLDAYNKALQLQPTLAEAVKGKERVLKLIGQV